MHAPSASVIVLLALAPAFWGLPNEVLAALTARGRRRAFLTGAHLAHQGERNDAVHVILRGRVCLECTHPSLLEPVAVTELGPGRLVGECGALCGRPRAFDAVAVEPTDALEWAAAELAEVLAGVCAAAGLLRRLARPPRQPWGLARLPLEADARTRMGALELRRSETRRRCPPK